MSRRIFKVEAIGNWFSRLSVELPDGDWLGVIRDGRDREDDPTELKPSIDKLLELVSERGVTAHDLQEWPYPKEDPPHVYYLDLNGERV